MVKTQITKPGSGLFRTLGFKGIEKRWISAMSEIVEFFLKCPKLKF
jgi:hypothetical protein